MVFVQEEFDNWLEEAKKYDILVRDDIGFVYYQARLLRLWHTCLRAMRVCFEFYPQKLKEAFEENEYFVNLLSHYHMGTEILIELEEDFFKLHTYYFDEDNITECSSLLEGINTEEIFITHPITTLDEITIEKNYFKEFSYNFIKKFYPSMDKKGKKKLLSNIARYICQDKSNSRVMVRIQTAIVKIIYLQLFKGLCESILSKGDIFDREYVRSYYRDILEKEESLLDEIKIVQEIYETFYKKKTYPLLYYLKQETLEKTYLDRFINGLKEGKLKPFAELL